MQVSRTLALTAALLLQAVVVAPAQARGGWDGNGLRVSGVSAAAVVGASGAPAGASSNDSQGMQLRGVALPAPATIPVSRRHPAR